MTYLCTMCVEIYLSLCLATLPSPPRGITILTCNTIDLFCLLFALVSMPGWLLVLHVRFVRFSYAVVVPVDCSFSLSQ